jgi:hypothetical protein
MCKMYFEQLCDSTAYCANRSFIRLDESSRLVAFSPVLGESGMPNCAATCDTTYPGASRASLQQIKEIRIGVQPPTTPHETWLMYHLRCMLLLEHASRVSKPFPLGSTLLLFFTFLSTCVAISGMRNLSIVRQGGILLP